MTQNVLTTLVRVQSAAGGVRESLGGAFLGGVVSVKTTRIKAEASLTQIGCLEPAFLFPVCPHTLCPHRRQRNHRNEICTRQPKQTHSNRSLHAIVCCPGFSRGPKRSAGPFAPPSDSRLSHVVYPGCRGNGRNAPLLLSFAPYLSLAFYARPRAFHSRSTLRLLPNSSFSNLNSSFSTEKSTSCLCSALPLVSFGFPGPNVTCKPLKCLSWGRNLRWWSRGTPARQTETRHPSVC